LVEHRDALCRQTLAEEQLDPLPWRGVPRRPVEDHDVDGREVPLELDEQLLPAELRRRSCD
jgi:hypothetical protein